MNCGFGKKSPLTPLCQRGAKDSLPLWKRGMKGDFEDLTFLCSRRIAKILRLKEYRREDGFTMVELMITMVIFVIVIAAASQVFTGLLTQFKQQSKIGETDIEGAVGLEILRRDLAHAGSGLPWTLTTSTGNTATYLEAANDAGTLWNDGNLNDGPPNNPARGTDPAGSSNPPGAFRLLTTGAGIQDSAAGAYVPNSIANVLTIKSVNVAMNDTCQKSTHIANNGALPNIIRVWNSTGDDLVGSDLVIVLNPSDGVNQNVLLNSGGSNFSMTWNDNSFSFNQGGPNYTSSGFEPLANGFNKFVVYGLAPSGVTPRMPFNRADYYVKKPLTDMPKRCAPYTGILYKSTVNQADGKHTELPLLDCVADLQVDFVLVDNNGNIVWPPTNDISGLTADQIRTRVKEIRVYIVAHEGQKDINYDFSQGGTRTSLNATEINPIDPSNPDPTIRSRTFSTVNLENLVGPEYKYYRWKLYTVVVQPNSLR